MRLSITLNQWLQAFWVMNSFEDLMKATDPHSAENRQNQIQDTAQEHSRILFITFALNLFRFLVFGGGHFWSYLTRGNKDWNLKTGVEGARVLPCSQDRWPGTYCVAQISLKFSHFPASTSSMQELQACATTLDYILFSYYWLIY